MNCKNSKNNKCEIETECEEDISSTEEMDKLSMLFELIDRLDNRMVYLFGEIEQSTILDVIAQIHILEKKSNEDITLFINSDGGYISDCLALIDVMNSSLCDIHTVVLGRAASAACLVASNGTIGKRFAGKNSEFMYHEATSFLPEVKPSQMSYFAKEFARIEQKCNRLFMQNTGRCLDDIKEVFLSSYLDRWMAAREAKQFGIVDKILTSKRKVFLEKKALRKRGKKK